MKTSSTDLFDEQSEEFGRSVRADTATVKPLGASEQTLRGGSNVQKPQRQDTTREDKELEKQGAMREEKHLTLMTVGFSTRSQEEFLEILRAHSVTCLADIRTIPRSRRNPQFNREELARRLPAAGIAYVHLAALGGLRRPRKDSRNTGWQNAGFRGFADYMETERFEEGLRSLLELGRQHRTAIACAEAVPWRCHRSLVADALTIRGVVVLHLMNKTHVRSHTLTPFARVDGERITYPGLL